MSRPHTQEGTQRQPTLRDVAALADVDPSVVSRVLNDNPRLSITPETRARVVAAIKELDYRPNVMARGLRLSRTWTIGLVLPDLTNPVYGQMVKGAQIRAQGAGYAVVVGSPLNAHSIEPSFARLLEEGRFDGLLVASAMLDGDDIRELASGAPPVVIVNRRVDGVEASVILDDAAGSSLATGTCSDWDTSGLPTSAAPPTSTRPFADARASRERPPEIMQPRPSLSQGPGTTPNRATKPRCACSEASSR